MAKSLQEHLTATEGLARLAAHAERLMAFQRNLEAVLPPALAPHARVANFKLGKVVIHANNSAVAAKVRQMGPRIAMTLSASGIKVTEIGVSVHPLPAAQPLAPFQRPKLPGARQKLALQSFTEGLPAGSALRRALERLVKAVKE